MDSQPSGIFLPCGPVLFLVTLEELVSFFTRLKQKYFIITFYHVIGSDHPPLVASSACIYEKSFSPCPCCRLLYLLDFQYNSYSPLHSAVGGTDLPILGSSFHLSWKVLCVCSELVLVSHCCLGLICENGFVYLLKLGKLKENAGTSLISAWPHSLNSCLNKKLHIVSQSIFTPWRQ